MPHARRLTGRFFCVLISLMIAFAVPRSLADRLSPRWVWIIPTAVVVGMLIYERRWFV